MKKVLFGGFLILTVLGPLGCSSNSLDKEASSAVSQLSAAASKINTLAATVNDAVKTAKNAKTAKAKKLDFKKAKEELKSLAKTAETLLEIDNKLPRKPLSDEQKKELKTQLGTQIKSAMTRVEKASEELNKAIAEARKIDEERTDEFVTELTATLNQFTQIATRHE